MVRRKQALLILLPFLYAPLRLVCWAQAQRAKIEGTIGRHSLRHSYRAWLDETGSATRCSAEADAPRQHFNHDECLRWRVHGRKTQGEHIRRAAGSLPKTVQIAKGRVVGPGGDSFSLNGLFWTWIENSNFP